MLNLYADTLVGLHVKGPLLLADLNQNWNAQIVVNL